MKNINSILRMRISQKEIIITLMVTIISYTIFITNFLINNHNPRLPWVGYFEQIHAGRWFNFFLSILNYQADIPVLFPLIGGVIGVSCAFVALSIWKQDLTTFERVVVASAITTFPVSLAYYYYTFQTPLFYAAWGFAVMGAFLALRGKLASDIAGSLFVMLTCASNQTTVNVYPVLIATAAIARLSDPENDLKKTAWLMFRAGCVLVSGLLLYVVSLKVIGLSSPNGSAIVSIRLLPAQIWKALHSALSHLWLTQPELLRFQKVALLAALLIAVAISFYRARRSTLHILFLAALWIASIAGTKMLFMVVQTGSYFDYRYSGAMSFFHAFTFAYVFGAIRRKEGPLWYIVAAMLAFIVLRFVQADLVRQSVLLRGQQHDLALANRILTRIETLPSLDVSQKYDLVRIGKYSTYRTDLLAFGGNRSQIPGDGHMDAGELTDVWTDESVFRLLGSSVQFTVIGMDPDYRKKIDAARRSLLPDRKPWPDASSVFIDNKTIYVYMR